MGRTLKNYFERFSRGNCADCKLHVAANSKKLLSLCNFGALQVIDEDVQVSKLSKCGIPFGEQGFESSFTDVTLHVGANSEKTAFPAQFSFFRAEER